MSSSSSETHYWRRPSRPRGRRRDSRRRCGRARSSPQARLGPRGDS
jgi:hypothetical protein